MSACGKSTQCTSGVKHLLTNIVMKVGGKEHGCCGSCEICAIRDVVNCVFAACMSNGGNWVTVGELDGVVERLAEGVVCPLPAQLSVYMVRSGISYVPGYDKMCSNISE